MAVETDLGSASMPTHPKMAYDDAAVWTSGGFRDIMDMNKDKNNWKNNLALADYQWELGELSAQRDRDFQERMANTEWQRAVEDMRKAGLNPILAYTQGPNSSPAGAQGPGTSVGYSGISGSPGAGMERLLMAAFQAGSRIASSLMQMYGGGSSFKVGF